MDDQHTNNAGNVAASQAPVAKRKEGLLLPIMLTIWPFIGIMLAILLFAVVNFMFAMTADGGSQSIFKKITDVFLFLIGAISVMSIPTGLAIGITLLATMDSERSQTAAIIFAVLFGFFTWTYTYDKDKKKFWLHAGLTLLTLGLWSIPAWIWAIVDTAQRPESFYKTYLDVEPQH